MKNAAVNMGVQIYDEPPYCFLFFLIVTAPIYIPTNSTQEFPFLHIIPAFISCLFNSRQIWGDIVMIFPKISEIEYLFKYPLAIYSSSLEPPNVIWYIFYLLYSKMNFPFLSFYVIDWLKNLGNFSCSICLISTLYWNCTSILYISNELVA